MVWLIQQFGTKLTENIVGGLGPFHSKQWDYCFELKVSKINSILIDYLALLTITTLTFLFSGQFAAQFKYIKPGNHCFLNFSSRHEETLRLRVSENISRNRSMVSTEILSSYFDLGLGRQHFVYVFLAKMKHPVVALDTVG